MLAGCQAPTSQEWATFWQEFANNYQPPPTTYYHPPQDTMTYSERWADFRQRNSTYWQEKRAQQEYDAQVQKQFSDYYERYK